jgi:hypothetical protein
MEKWNVFGANGSEEVHDVFRQTTDKQPILCSCDFFRMASTCQDISNLEGNCKGPVIKPLHKN